MKLKKPKCKYCWDKGYSTQLVDIVKTHLDCKIFGKHQKLPGSGIIERKIYCTKCNKGKRLKKKDARGNNKVKS